MMNQNMSLRTLIALSTMIIPLAAQAQNKETTDDDNLDKPIQFEGAKLDKKAITLDRRKVQLDESGNSKTDGKQRPIGQSVAALLPRSPIEAAIAQLDQSNNAILEALNEMGVLGRMKADFERIRRKKSMSQRKRAIDQYQAQYAAPYRRALKKSNVDLADIAKGLNQEISAMEFKVIDGLYIVSKKRKSSKKKTQTTEAASWDISLSDDDFEYRSEGNCAIAAGGGAGFSDGKISSNATAILAGYCRWESIAEYDFSAREDGVATAKFDGSVSGVAGSVLGSSFAYQSIGRRIHSESENIACGALAAIFWVGYCSEEDRNISVSSDIEGGFEVTLRLRTYHGVLGAVGVSFSNASARLQDNQILIEEHSQ